jgi:hypothetical protein
VTEESNTLGVQADKVYTAKCLPKFIEKPKVPTIEHFRLLNNTKKGQSPKKLPSLCNNLFMIFGRDEFPIVTLLFGKR